ncbi:MAG: PatB family C-S lyase [Gallionella sp.]
MPVNFDRYISRSNTSSFKYDARADIFGKRDVIPLWVADMDFAVPESVQRALMDRVRHPIYGYTIYPESLYHALISWLVKCHDWLVRREQIMLCPGVVPSLHASIVALTQPGDAVIVQPPVYAPFLAAPKITGRKLMLNPLKFVNGHYSFDLEHFEQCVAGGARLLLLCSPHNPVGRVWQPQELQALLEICQRYGVTVISDEIHADLTYPGTRHTPLARLAQGKVNVVTAIAPSKTFNMPSLGLSALIVPNECDRVAIGKVFDTLHVSAANPFSIVAFEAAYRGGLPWLEELRDYLAGTRDLVRDFLAQNLAQIKLIEPEGSYLLWLDCRDMKLDEQQLKRFFVEKAGVGLTPGILFGEQGSGFMRMNIAAPRSIVAQALEQIVRADQARK